MKKILTLSIVIAMALVSVSALASDPCPDCEWNCTWDDDNCIGPITTRANVVGNGAPGGGQGGGDLEDGAPIIVSAK